MAPAVTTWMNEHSQPRAPFATQPLHCFIMYFSIELWHTFSRPAWGGDVARILPKTNKWNWRFITKKTINQNYFLTTRWAKFLATQNHTTDVQHYFLLCFIMYQENMSQCLLMSAACFHPSMRVKPTPPPCIINRILLYFKPAYGNKFRAIWHYMSQLLFF